jgi:hypothetical protein
MTGLRNSVTLYNAFDVYSTSKWSRKRKKVWNQINKTQKKERKKKGSSSEIMQPGGRGRFADGATLSQNSHAHVVGSAGAALFFSFFQQQRPIERTESRPQKTYLKIKNK